MVAIAAAMDMEMVLVRLHVMVALLKWYGRRIMELVGQVRGVVTA